MQSKVINNLLLNFLMKYFFILQAASDGWRICYLGGNKFEFYSTLPIQDSGIIEGVTGNFIEKYSSKFKDTLKSRDNNFR